MYKLTLTFQNNPVFIDRPMLDSILYYALACEHFGGPPPQKLHLSQQELLPLDPIPLVRDPQGWFRCSWLLWDEAHHAEYTTSWKKRWASQCDHLADFGKGKAKVDTQRGFYKSYDVPLAAHALTQAWFYLETAEPERLLALLQKWVVGIGKKRGTGYGWVSQWTLTPVAPDPELVRLRPIPATLAPAGQGRSQAFASWLPPHWLPDNQVVCSVPIV